MKLLQIIFEFFKTGLCSIGGGLATLPFLYDMGEKYGWFTAQDVADMLAISESTPGPIGVNMATYVGVEQFGVLGGLVTTLSLVAPSIIVIILVASVLQRFRENRFVQASLSSLRPVSVGLVAAAVLTVFTTSLINLDALLAGQWAAITTWGTVLTFAVLLFVRVKWSKLHPIVLVIIGAAAGILLKL